MSSRTLAIQYGDGKATKAFNTGYVARNGEVLGITIVNAGGVERIGSMVRPDKMRDIPNEAWSGSGAVTINGRTYTVPATVPCYNRETGNWVTLTEARMYASTCDLYVYQGVVRFLEVG